MGARLLCCSLVIVIDRAALPHICNSAAVLRYGKHDAQPSADLIKRLLATALTTQHPECHTLMQTDVSEPYVVTQCAFLFVTVQDQYGGN
jgi:hypothetical protein